MTIVEKTDNKKDISKADVILKNIFWFSSSETDKISATPNPSLNDSSVTTGFANIFFETGKYNC